jgi:hypothetical protein
MGSILGNFGFFRHFVFPDTIVGSGKLVSQHRSVPAFHAARLDGIGKVIVAQGTTEKVRVEADDNIIDFITTEVRDGVLRIGIKEASYDSVTVNIYISMKEIEAAIIEGAGEFASVTPMRCQRLSLLLKGSGSVNFYGMTDELNILLSGMGEVQCSNLVATICSVRISGMGNCQVNAVRELDARVTGAGQIIYEGEPSVVHKSVTGMGNISKK